MDKRRKQFSRKILYFLLSILSFLLLFACKETKKENKSTTKSLDQVINERMAAEANRKQKKLKENQAFGEKLDRERNAHIEKILETRKQNKLTGENKKAFISLTEKEVDKTIRDITASFEKVVPEMDSIHVKDNSVAHGIALGKDDYESFTIYSFKVFLIKRRKIINGGIINSKAQLLGEFKFTDDKKLYFIPKRWTNEDKEQVVELGEMTFLNKAKEIVKGDLSFSQSSMGTVYFNEKTQ